MEAATWHCVFKIGKFFLFSFLISHLLYIIASLPTEVVSQMEYNDFNGKLALISYVTLGMTRDLSETAPFKNFN